MVACGSLLCFCAICFPRAKGGEEVCESCDSPDIYYSPNGYDSVVVCNECHAELHKPRFQEEGER